MSKKFKNFIFRTDYTNCCCVSWCICMVFEKLLKPKMNYGRLLMIYFVGANSDDLEK